MDSMILDSSDGFDNMQTCLVMCQENLECKFFTFHEEESRCDIFVDCLNFSRDSCSDCYSGPTICEGKVLSKVLFKNFLNLFFQC